MTNADTAVQATAAALDKSIKLVDLQYNGKKGGPYHVRVYLSIRGGRPDMGAGYSTNGLFNAIAGAIENVLPHGATTFELKGVVPESTGTDAVACVTVVLKVASGIEYEKEGRDTDTATAFALAYIAALNAMRA